MYIYIYMYMYVCMDQLSIATSKNPSVVNTIYIIYIYKRLKNSILALENNFKPINISVNDMDKFKEETELT